HARVVRERARDRDALLLAARELARQVVEPPVEADALEQLLHPLAAVAPCEVRRRERRLDVLRRGERRDEVELLEHEPEGGAPQPRQLGVPHRSEVASLEEDGALARAVEAAEQLEQRRLAGAARSDHREEVAAVDHEVDLAHRAYLRAAHGVGAADAPELVGGCVVHQPRWRSASAGRRRAARRPPTAPATSPAATASTTARRTTFASIG